VVAEVAIQDGTGQAAKLEALAERINSEHRACETAANAALRHALEAGRLLEEAKAHHKHGGWRAWVKENFKGSERTDRLYRQIWRERGRLEEEAKRQGVAALSIVTAMRYMARKPDPWELPPGNTPLLTPDEEERLREQEKRQRAEEAKKQRLMRKAEFAIRTGQQNPPADLTTWEAQKWRGALYEARHLREANLPNIIDRLAHQLDILSEHANAERVARYLAEPTNNREVNEERALILAELRDGASWLTAVLEEADRTAMQDPAS
jgi:hypothetical protein